MEQYISRNHCPTANRVPGQWMTWTFIIFRKSLIRFRPYPCPRRCALSSSPRLTITGIGAGNDSDCAENASVSLPNHRPTQSRVGRHIGLAMASRLILRNENGNSAMCQNISAILSSELTRLGANLSTGTASVHCVDSSLECICLIYILADTLYCVKLGIK